MASPSPPGLLDLIRQRYLETLRSVQSRWKVLVVDEYTNKLLHAVLTTYEILEEGVQQVDIISNARSSQPRLAAIYLLMPTSRNVELVLRDYSSSPPPQPTTSRSSKKNVAPPPSTEPPKYAGAHLHFVDGIDDALVGRLTDGLPDNYLLALKELYVNFHALESRVFSLKTPNAFNTLFAPPETSPKDSLDRWEDEIGWMSRALVNTLATLGEYPLIRYYNPPDSFHKPLGPAQAAGIHVGKRLAERVQQEIDAYARDNSNFPPIPDPPRPRGILFITDRSMDLYAPLLHEFTYQAMCNDLLDIEDGVTYRYTFHNSQGGVEDKEATLSDEDKVWTQVRHMHMKDALDKLIADFKAYAGEHGGKFGSDGGTSLNDMKDMLASLPQLRDAKDKLSLHLTMAEKCMALFEKKKLPLSASVEQCCATGVTPEGKTPKTLVEEMVPLLDDRSVSSVDKLRIIAMYIMHRDGVPEGDKKRLYQHARLALHEMDAVDNLTYLGINVSKDSGKKRKALFKQRTEDDAYDISRYQPLIKYMLDEYFAGTLDQTVFPYVRDAPVTGGSSSSRNAAAAPAAAGSLRSARPQWTSTRGRRTANEPRQRVIVFVAGGMTYSEVRVGYKLSESANKDIFMGSTHLITPEKFVSDLSNLDRGAGASLSASHGPTSATSYQTRKPSKSSAPPPPSAQIAQSSTDRRYGSTSSGPPPPSSSQGQYRGGASGPPPPSQHQQQPYYPQQQPSRSSYHDSGPPPPSNGGGGGYLPKPTSRHSPTPSAVSSVMTMDSTAGANGEKKKKKGFFSRK